MQHIFFRGKISRMVVLDFMNFRNPIFGNLMPSGILLVEFGDTFFTLIWRDCRLEMFKEFLGFSHSFNGCFWFP